MVYQFEIKNQFKITYLRNRLNPKRNYLILL